ncbi:MAG: aldo/keto reductase [Bacteroidales bacterium]|nr:aldo/keto reductase [Bacteroidales bacterium]
MKQKTVSRREFVKLSAAAAAGLTILPGFRFGLDQLPAPMKRSFGKIPFEVSTLGLGGQASLQWTPADVDPVPIILKAFRMGINYFDTSNLYDGSQLNFGKAFRQLNLIPGQTGYDENLRESIFLTTKTHQRWAKPGFPELKNVNNWSNGDPAGGAVADLKRSLSQMFGDGNGAYPEGSYVNMVLTHNLNFVEEVDVMYRGLETPLNQEENLGVLVALRDYRDGTNFTGLNPAHEKLIRHIGLSGHISSPAMMDMIRRDSYEILDAMLVAINANDRLYLNHQHNVIPVAQAKNMGIIAMKVFADGAMYSKYADWTRDSDGVVRSVGTRELPSKPLIEYALTTPGIHTAIIGIGQISEDHLKCQLVQNYYAAQITPDGLSREQREKIEKDAKRAKGGKTNYFQLPARGLTPPQDIKIGGAGQVEISWNSALAADDPLSHYEVYQGENLVANILHEPQISMEPFSYKVSSKEGSYKVVTVDRAGRRAESEALKV